MNHDHADDEDAADRFRIFWTFENKNLPIIFPVQKWVLDDLENSYIRTICFSDPKTVKKNKMNFKNDLKVFFKRRQRRPLTTTTTTKSVGFVLVCLLLLSRFQESKAACSCDSSVPACESPFTSGSSPSTDQAGPNCPKVARSDCPCCFVCAVQLGQSCSSSEPCDPALGLVCNDGKCQKGKYHF